ncbi:MAG: damage repair protein [Bacilli bacterium]|nr:damage repair protein [Bacilli bacterium]
MNDLYPKRNIIAIDLKSFFASCECVERGIDGSSAPLVVCDPVKKGAMTLAVSPYLKNLGVKGRTRVYDLPKNIKIIKVPPRMGLYKKKSKEVIKVYEEFVAKDDMHIYSIDEVFLDVTSYLSLYQKSASLLAEDILKRIKEKTGLTAVAGIGPNIFLAKVCMDLESKHSPNNISSWSYDDVASKLWNTQPLSKVWGIGIRMEKRLNALQLYKIGDIARSSRFILKEKFGVLGEELWYRANGIDLTKISDLNAPPKNESISHSQILYKDYDESNINIIIKEMIDLLTKRLRNMKKNALVVGLFINYSKSIGGGFSHSIKLDKYTKDSKEIFAVCLNIFNKYYDYLPIRQVGVYLACLSPDNGIQLNLFEPYKDAILAEEANQAVDLIKDKYGTNSLLKASSLLEDSTIIARNHKNGDERY